jgi:hypothetical protein
MVQPPRNGYIQGMKPKTMFYAGLGFVTFKAGKVLAKRKVRAALRGSKSDRGSGSGRDTS